MIFLRSKLPCTSYGKNEMQGFTQIDSSGLCSGCWHLYLD
ncbi:BnaCnng42670D [Brassica napus]|uniref:BnaCnng42670D protein n=1 Tax=Brassica napus TaxID=3708 RepID=A0A078JER0_BRANA|nr:BnaCnng42670D [Brassica napus]